MTTATATATAPTARRFTVERGGDPYSSAAWVTEHTAHGDVFCGDLSGLASARPTESRLRRMFPGCKVTRA